MFSANENLQLRQYKRQIVGFVEECIPEEALDLGVSVMVMQTFCKTPGCVPVETAVVIVFPSSSVELLPGLPESKGGSYKTKVLKPMSSVTKQDVLEALPPEFPGGLRSLEKLCIQARDIMLGQITQLFDDDDVHGRQLMAEYLQKSLQEYIDRKCVPPEWGEPFGSTLKDENKGDIVQASGEINASFAGSKNVIIQRILDDDPHTRPDASGGSEVGTNATAHGTTDMLSSPHQSLVDSVSQRRRQQVLSREVDQLMSGESSSILSRIAEREHAPGIRRRGCPCCDPDNPQNVIDRLLQF